MNGEKRIEWVSQFMPVLNKIKDDYERDKPLKGLSIGMALHVEPKTCFLVRTLEAGGADVSITGCNPLSTQDDVVEALKATGTKAYAKHGQSRDEYYDSLNKILDSNPDAVIDDGCDLILLLHKERKELLEKIKGACEETTTGIHRLKAMAKDGALKFPVMNVNDAKCKHLFDNFYGTGESTLSSIMTTTNLILSGKTFVVGGYGYCGRGIATKARGLGAHVIVTEVDPVKALQARMDGYTVMPMAEAVKKADFVVTATGMRDIVTPEHFKAMKNKCILANSGHFDIEVDLEGLEEITKKENVNEDIDAYTFPNGKKVFVLAQGRLVNLATSKGLGHPIEIMDLSFCLQALGVKYVLENKLEPGVHSIPKSIDDLAAQMKLEAMGIKKDSLTREQEEYGSAWEVGT